MHSVISACATFFIYALIAAFTQNALLARGMGISRTMQLVGDDDTSTVLFGILLSVVCFLDAPLSWALNLAVEKLSFRTLVRPLAYVICSVVVCLVLWFVLTKVEKLPFRTQLLTMLPNACFNACIAGTLLVTTIQDYTLPQTMGFGFGSGLGFFMATLLVTEARRRLQDSNVPSTFRGLPIVLLYIGILSLAVYGFTGHAVTI